VNHISVITCVFAAGESLTAYIIASQGSPSVQEQLKKRGVRFGTDLTMKLNAKPYINAETFLDYVRTVFLSNLAEFRRLDEFADEMAVFLMDNCPSYITSDVIALLTEARVLVITFAPHTAHNSDLSSSRPGPVWCSQTGYKIRIPFRRRDGDRYIHNEAISRVQTSNGRTSPIFGFVNREYRTDFLTRGRNPHKKIDRREEWSQKVAHIQLNFVAPSYLH
jgi:hypothetical protein